MAAVVRIQFLSVKSEPHPIESEVHKDVRYQEFTEMTPGGEIGESLRPGVISFARRPSGPEPIVSPETKKDSLSWAAEQIYPSTADGHLSTVCEKKTGVSLIYTTFDGIIWKNRPLKSGPRCGTL